MGKITRRVSVPTGDICIFEGDKGPLEFLSIGDYGKDVNLKCDAMGLDRPLDHVVHQKMLPLEKKWVVTISTQYGCSMGCTFCDVPKVGPGVNATRKDMMEQVRLGLSLHPEVVKGERLNIHYARMGEPTFNWDVPTTAVLMKARHDSRFDVIHPVVSTMMPKANRRINHFLDMWMDVKNSIYEGNAGLQLSINSTDEEERDRMFGGTSMTLDQISDLVRGYRPKGRKITLNFAIAGWTIDAELLARLFNPEHFIIKLTPMHKTHTAIENDIKTEGNYTEYAPYEEDEAALKAAGFDVLVFIASVEEDLGRITCGNAILSGSKPDIQDPDSFYREFEVLG